MRSSNEDAKGTDEKVGLYATGQDEGPEDDLDWIPEELLEGGAERAREDSKMGESSREEEIIGCEPCGEVKAKTWTSPTKPTEAEVT